MAWEPPELRTHLQLANITLPILQNTPFTIELFWSLSAAGSVLESVRLISVQHSIKLEMCCSFGNLGLDLTPRGSNITSQNAFLKHFIGRIRDCEIGREPAGVGVCSSYLLE